MSIFTDALNLGQQAHNGNISYFFSANFSGWNSHERVQTELALEQWQNVANITFSQAPTEASADFVFNNITPSLMNQLTGSTTTLGTFHLPNSAGSTQQGFFNNGATGWDKFGLNDGLEQGGYGFITILHEVGHGLGLDHPHGGTSFPGVSNGFDTGDFDYNQGVNTVMSYNDGLVSNNLSPSTTPDYGWTGTAMAFDIAAIQELYGANNSFASGNNAYYLDSANTTGTFYSSIWDTGGKDTIYATGNRGSTINLNAASLVNGDPDAGGAISANNNIFGGFTIANGVEIENATGSSGADIITGNDISNVLRGNGGNDIISAGAGNDYINGGAGNDTLKGDAGNDILDGSSGADIFNGGAGNDIMFIDNSDTTLDGGADYDRIYVRGYSTGVNVNMTSNNLEYANGNYRDDTLNATGSNVSVKLLGQGGDDVLTGGNVADQLYGSNGDDILRGNGGNDIMNAGAGADQLFGGAGNDLMFMDTADTAIDGGAGYDRVYVSTGGIGNLNMTSSHMEYASGNAGADTFDATGSAVSVKLLGRGGNDTLTGGNANDLLYGEAGNDTLEGGAGNDIMNGGAGNDFLYGDAGNDIILGGTGIDQIYGGSGDDIIYGGGGTDTFSFTALGWGDDDILDFIEGEKMDMRGTGLIAQDLEISTDGNDTLIQFTDFDDTILLVGVTTGIDATDFTF